jgi:hypothetical protein
MKKRIFVFIKFIFVTSILFVTMNADAKERFEFYNGVRSLGMGGVTAAVVNDETALLSNPAALGKLRDYFVTVLDPELELGADTDALLGGKYTAFLDPQDTLDKAQASPGKRLHQRVQLFPSFVTTNFGLGVYGRYVADAMVSADSTTYEYEYRNDYALVLGFNLRLFDGRIKFGINARGVNRVEVQRDDIAVAATGLDFEAISGTETLAREGFGIGTDVGLIFTGPWKTLPTLAFVYHDAGITSYDMNDGYFFITDRRPERTPPTLDVGLGFFPIVGKNSRMAISVEMMDVLDALEPVEDEKSDEVMRRLHAGMEVNFSDIFFLRLGMNQGYLTYGLELAIENTQLQFASYGEEVGDVIAAGGTGTYTAVEDRRYVGKFSYRF